MNDTHTVEIEVTTGTVEKLHRFAIAWNCSVDEALDRIVAEAGGTREREET